MYLVISYAPHETAELAQQIQAALETIEGVTVWLDETASTGMERVTRLQAAIQQADLVLTILSPEVQRKSLPPNILLMDISFAQQDNKEIIPIQPYAFPLPAQLAHLDFHDFTLNRPAALRKLVAAIREKAGVKEVATIKFDQETTGVKLREYLAQKQAEQEGK